MQRSLYELTDDDINVCKLLALLWLCSRFYKDDKYLCEYNRIRSEISGMTKVVKRRKGNNIIPTSKFFVFEGQILVFQAINKEKTKETLETEATAYFATKTQ